MLLVNIVGKMLHYAAMKLYKWDEIELKNKIIAEKHPKAGRNTQNADTNAPKLFLLKSGQYEWSQ